MNNDSLENVMKRNSCFVSVSSRFSEQVRIETPDFFLAQIRVQSNFTEESENGFNWSKEMFLVVFWQ